jgi:N-[(2S)-2-amino-2-carboxyethyl]-L-glutamate dehydrogenase
MLYLNERDIHTVGMDWKSLISEIRDATKTVSVNDYAQPLKPYLRYKDMKNRIIAMPAYMGGKFSVAGIKWIASFPDNIKINKPRAHSITILNDADTGAPVCTINTSLISAIRTASVTGLVIEEFLKHKNYTRPLEIGIVGFGPIGQVHLKMLASLLKDVEKKISVYDIQKPSLEGFSDTIAVKDSWQEVYENADIVITCTVTKERYINLPPKKGSLQLNISLRDYLPQIHEHVNFMVVDEWSSVCRENTDIELMYKEKGLQEDDAYSMESIICDDLFNRLSPDDVVMFNPMGMAIFDIVIGAYYYKMALQQGVGVSLN